MYGKKDNMKDARDVVAAYILLQSTQVDVSLGCQAGRDQILGLSHLELLACDYIMSSYTPTSHHPG